MLLIKFCKKCKKCIVTRNDKTPRDLKILEEYKSKKMVCNCGN
jgi:hypothetical protein